MSYLGSIRVEDGSGDQFDVHEFRDSMLRRRYVLDTGETVRRIDNQTFTVDRTGETLMRA